ncbi:MAG: recombinase RecT [Deltaproteobacteria bacterium]|nr:recombinase RecT [Deltaproteobacteria bacterium]
MAQQQTTSRGRGNQSNNVPATIDPRVTTIRTLFNDNRVKSEIAKALPKHLNADKLIRVAMTSIQRTPKLVECSQQSLLACLMTCAALGLEPDPFLGQAYLVPFWNSHKRCFEAQFMPGYRGYIALARRTGDVQTVSAQVVYTNDFFKIRYGLQEELDHIPADGERGEIRGAYVIFRYKDGSYSFDYMPFSEIMEIAKRSKTYDAQKDAWDGPWSTDAGEMCKKTVIKRHGKLVPMSIEYQRAAALEDRAFLGETQMDLLTDDMPGTLIDAGEDYRSEGEMSEEARQKMIAQFDASLPKNTNMEFFDEFIQKTAEINKCSVDDVKISAVGDGKTDDLIKLFGAWVKQRKAKEKKEPENGKQKTVENKEPGAKDGENVSNIGDDDNGELAPGPCPNNLDVTYKASYCNKECGKREGCPVWLEADGNK